MQIYLNKSYTIDVFYLRLLTEVADVLERVELQQHRLEEDNTRLEDELKRTKSLLKAKEEEIQTMKV